MEKKQIRALVSARRAAASDQEIERKSRIICEKILETKEFQEAEAIYVYMDFKHEVSTRILLEEAWRQGKRVAAPKVHPDGMCYYYITSYEDVHPGFFGVPEPDAVHPAGDETALLIVPGVGFDADGNRCGYGKGYYDRYLCVHDQHVTFAVAFEFQLVDHVPTDSYDIAPQVLFTEERILRRTERKEH